MENFVKITMLSWPYSLKTEKNEWIYCRKFGLKSIKMKKKKDNLGWKTTKLPKNSIKYTKTRPNPR